MAHLEECSPPPRPFWIGAYIDATREQSQSFSDKYNGFVLACKVGQQACEMNRHVSLSVEGRITRAPDPGKAQGGKAHRDGERLVEAAGLARPSLDYLLDFYAKQKAESMRHKRSAGTVSEDSADGWTLGEVQLFARDFDLLPKLVSLEEIKALWVMVVKRGARGRIAELREWLARLALFIWSKPGIVALLAQSGYSSLECSAEDKCQHLIHYLRLGDLDRVRGTAKRALEDKLAYKHEVTSSSRLVVPGALPVRQPALVHWDSQGRRLHSCQLAHHSKYHEAGGEASPATRPTRQPSYPHLTPHLLALTSSPAASSGGAAHGRTSPLAGSSSRPSSPQSLSGSLSSTLQAGAANSPTNVDASSGVGPSAAPAASLPPEVDGPCAEETASPGRHPSSHAFELEACMAHYSPALPRLFARFCCDRNSREDGFEAEGGGAKGGDGQVVRSAGAFLDLGRLEPNAHCAVVVTLCNTSNDDIRLDITARDFEAHTEVKTLPSALIPGLSRTCTVTFRVPALPRSVVGYVDVGFRSERDCTVTTLLSVPCYYYVSNGGAGLGEGGKDPPPLHVASLTSRLRTRLGVVESPARVFGQRRPRAGGLDSSLALTAASSYASFASFS